MKRRVTRALVSLVLGSGAVAAQTVVDLQPFRQASSIQIRSKAGREGTATLVNLNPAINAWYLLSVSWNGGQAANYHLENASPRASRLVLDAKFPLGIVVEKGNNRFSCDFFGTGSLDQAKNSPLAYASLCEGQVYLRNTAKGSRSTLEAATDFLREHIWGGETIIGLGHVLMGDIHRETGELQSGSQPAAKGPADLPPPARIDPKFADRALQSYNLGINIENSGKGGMAPGAWYAANGNPGAYVSLLQPNLVDSAILQSYRKAVNPLDGAESSALVYLVAFDLDRFELGFEMGTEHPKVAWSDQVLPNMRAPGLPGPDGIGNISPLIPTGMISPADAGKTVAAFVGGFKRTHGAFKFGDLAQRNHGSHYGFLENGVVLSKLQPGLSTIVVLNDGSIRMKTWADSDNALLPTIRHARQNGVPLIEFDETLQAGIPGALVNRWGPGNWSGSQEKKLRTMRGGAALARRGAKRFLIYAVFSDATPSAMSRVFQAYGCDYAMLLDMNALEHTYFAMYRRAGPQLYVDHLLKGMSVLEKTSPSGEIVPRFLGYSDNREFFYVMRK